MIENRLLLLLAPIVTACLVPMLPCEAYGTQVLANGAVHRTSEYPQEDSFDVQDSPAAEPTRLIVDTRNLPGVSVRGHSIVDSEVPARVNVHLYDQAQATLNGIEYLVLEDESHAHVLSDTGINTYATVRGSSTLVWESPDYGQQLLVSENGHAELRTTSIKYVVGRNNANILMNAARGGIDDFRLFDTSFASMMDGVVGSGEGIVRLEGQSRFEMHGGLIGSPIEVFSDARLEIFGGTIHDWGVNNTLLDVDDNGIIRIHGSDFTVDGAPVGFGLLDAVKGQLGGTTLTGETFQYIHFSRSDGGRIELVPIPEPRLATLLLTGTVLLGLRGRSAAAH